MRERRVEIVPMREGDIDEVCEIEGHSFRAPWPRQVFLEELDREWAYLDVVRERGRAGVSRVVAFCNYWLVRDEVHLLNIATHPHRRRAGLGRRLMEHMLDFARRRSCRFVTLEVRRSNEAAIGLYQAYGFRAVGVRPRYYAEDGEDAIVMTLELDGDG
jgi:[ribosomal protein S18]-alanine N-acetyltransferase